MIDVRRFKRCPGACGRSCQENEKTEVVEICGHTYANKALRRYDTANYAEPVKATTLSALADYIVNCRGRVYRRQKDDHPCSKSYKSQADVCPGWGT